jgi:hypothetical protein
MEGRAIISSAGVETNGVLLTGSASRVFNLNVAATSAKYLFVTKCVHVEKQEGSADPQIRDPVVHFLSELMLASATIDRFEVLRTSEDAEMVPCFAQKKQCVRHLQRYLTAKNMPAADGPSAQQRRTRLFIRGLL